MSAPVFNTAMSRNISGDRRMEFACDDKQEQFRITITSKPPEGHTGPWGPTVIELTREDLGRSEFMSMSEWLASHSDASVRDAIKFYDLNLTWQEQQAWQREREDSMQHLIYRHQDRRNQQRLD